MTCDMKEIGGYMEFEYFHGKEFHENALGLNCGRNTLAYLIEAHQIKSIYLPYFFCSDVVDVCKKYSVSLHFYSIWEDFTPIVPDSFSSSDWLYVVNYYGQLDDAFLLSLREKNVIIDNAQAFFRMPLPNVPTLYTCRKFFGVSDGAYLYTTKMLERNLEIDESYNRMGFVLGRFERPASEFYQEASDNNSFFSNQPVKKMAPLTKNCLKAIDYELVRTRRNKNFSYLHSIFGSDNRLSLVNPDGAFAYPLYHEDGIRIRKQLAQNKIYIPTLWPNVLDSCSEDSIEYQYAANILPLPVDQRYGEDEMKTMVSKIQDIES